MRRIKKAEREAVVAALTLDHESVEGAAEAAIRAVDELREKELSKPANRPYVLLMQEEQHKEYLYTFGPYSTESQALKAQKELSAPSAGRSVARVQKLHAVKEQ